MRTVNNELERIDLLHRLEQGTQLKNGGDGERPIAISRELAEMLDDYEAHTRYEVSPHAIRRGSITHVLSQDVPAEVVGDRMNVSRDVLDKHYDKRSEDVKLEQRRGYLDNV